MGRNARRTHNLKNKRGARRDEGGVVLEGGLWGRERERGRVKEEEETGQVSARFLGWFARVRGGVKRGIYPAEG